MSRSIRLIQSIGLALSRRREQVVPPAPADGAHAAPADADRSVTVRAVRKLARGTRPPTHGDSH